MDPERLERTAYAGETSAATVLRTEAQRDTEAYWRPRGRMQAGALGRGVVAGLALQVQEGSVSVAPGIAVDAAGEIVSLAVDGTALVDGVEVEVTGDGVTLALPGGPGSALVRIAFHESVVGGVAARRVAHTPVLSVTALGDPPDVVDDGSVVLGRCSTGADGLTALDPGGRRVAAPSLRGLDLRASRASAGRLSDERVGTVAAEADGIGVGVGDGPEQLRIGASTVGIAADTTVAGSLAVTAGLSVGGAVAAAALDVAGATTTARLRVGERLQIGVDAAAPGDPVALDVGGGLRLRPAGAGTAGVLLSSHAVPDAAFVGMADDGHVGFSGSGGGFGLTMDTATGAVAVGGRLSTRGELATGGDVNVGGGVVVNSGSGVSLPMTGGTRARLAAGVEGAPFGTLRLSMGRARRDSNPPARFEIGQDLGVASFVTFFSVDHRGNATFGGSKGGYVVDHAVNRADRPLEPGDVVVLAPTAPAAAYGVDDTIPVLEVALTTRAADHRVCGVVAGAVDAAGLPPAGVTGGAESGDEHPLAHLAEPRDEGGPAMRPVGVGRLGRVVTLGAFARCRVDADDAPIAAGDLLVTAAEPGYARRAPDAVPPGSVVGKALAPLGSGRGVVPVLVTLH